MPFIKTALVSQGGTARESASDGQIYHFNMVRMRVTGNGNLKVKLFSLDEVNTEQIADMKLSIETNREPRSLANFIEPRAGVEVKTTTINEYFKINRIYLYTKFFASEYPG